MRFLTYNIGGCETRQAHFRGELVIENILSASPDFVALQEVFDDLRSERSFLRHLREIGFTTVHFGPTLRRPDSEYGNVLLLRGLPERIDEIDLSVDGYEPRGALRVKWVREGRSIEVVATHLGLGFRERRRQIRRLAGILGDAPPVPGDPAGRDDSIRIVLGDLNEWIPCFPGSRMFRRSLGSAPLLRTFPAAFPLLPLDRILVSRREPGQRWSVLSDSPHRRASDHLPVVLDLP